MFNFWWSAEQSEQKISWAIWAKNVKTQKNKKGPLSHRKNKMFVFQLSQLLMIGQAIQAKNVDQNKKKMKKAPWVIEN